MCAWGLATVLCDRVNDNHRVIFDEHWRLNTVHYSDELYTQYCRYRLFDSLDSTFSKFFFMDNIPCAWFNLVFSRFHTKSFVSYLRSSCLIYCPVYWNFQLWIHLSTIVFMILRICIRLFEFSEVFHTRISSFKVSLILFYSHFVPVQVNNELIYWRPTAADGWPDLCKPWIKLNENCFLASRCCQSGRDSDRSATIVLLLVCWYGTESIAGRESWRRLRPVRFPPSCWLNVLPLNLPSLRYGGGVVM